LVTFFVKNIWNKDEFIKVFNEILNSSKDYDCDFPYLKMAYSELICLFILDGTYSFNKISIKLTDDEDEDEENIWFFNGFIKECANFIKRDNDIQKYI